MSRPSIKDVAIESKVSHQTVSRVLNNSPRVSQETRKKVLASIEKLGYRINNSAKALASGKYKSIGVVNLNSTLFGPITMNTAIQKFAHEKHYSVNYLSIDKLSNSLILDGINSLLEKGVDGIVVIVPKLVQEIDSSDLRSFKVPIVMRDHSDMPDSLKLNHRLISEVATNYLLDLGHEKIGFIGGNQNWFDGIEREIGWRLAMKKCNLNQNRSFSGDWSAKSGYQLAAELIEKFPDTSAIYTASDLIGLGVLKYINEKKLSKIDIISSDAMPESSFYYPALTTVKYDYVELARRLFNGVLSLIAEEPFDSYNSDIPVELIVRESTKRTFVNQ